MTLPIVPLAAFSIYGSFSRSIQLNPVNLPTNLQLAIDLSPGVISSSSHPQASSDLNSHLPPLSQMRIPNTDLYSETGHTSIPDIPFAPDILSALVPQKTQVLLTPVPSALQPLPTASWLSDSGEEILPRCARYFEEPFYLRSSIDLFSGIME